MNTPTISQVASNSYQPVDAVKAASAVEAGKDAVKEVEAQKKQDAYVNSDSNSKVKDSTYKNPKRLSAEELKTISDQRMASFKNMLQTMLGKQVDTLNKSLFDGITITKEEKDAAAAAIAPGGEWSPEVVAGNILDMAKALSGGDESKIALLKSAVIKGFAEAEKAWGGKLPSITDETYDLVMKGFDEWEKGTSTSKTSADIA